MIYDIYICMYVCEYIYINDTRTWNIHFNNATPFWYILTIGVMLFLAYCDTSSRCLLCQEAWPLRRTDAWKVNHWRTWFWRSDIQSAGRFRFPDFHQSFTCDHRMTQAQHWALGNRTLGARGRWRKLAGELESRANVDGLRGDKNDRRKFRSQTSDNMDRWKAEQGRGREKRKIGREKSRRERVRRKKMQMREKVGKSRNTVFFQWFGAPEARKVGSLKRRVRRQLARWEMKNCTPLWREAHFEVKMYKTHQRRTTFGSWDVEKVHAVVAQLRCRKSARRCGAKHISKSKVLKTGGLGPLLEVEM